jgi:hypothetical protein
MRCVLVLLAIATVAIVAGVSLVTFRGWSETRTPGPVAPPLPPLLAVNDPVPPAWWRALQGSAGRSDAGRPLQVHDFGHLQLDNLGTRGAEAVFLVYRTRAGRSCFDVQFVAGNGSGLRPLRCRGATRCRDLCLVAVSGKAAGRHHTILAGIVAKEVRSVAVRLADGAEGTYDVFGTAISSIGGERVFMLEVTDRRVVAIEPA